MNTVGSVLHSRSLVILGFALFLFFGAEAMVAQFAGASGAPPALNVSPQGNLTNGQTVSVSVGSNGFFTPHARVNILECADPGGSAANLPRDDSTCDGNTIQGTTLLVGGDGSFSDSSYPVYALPSATLGEQGNSQPVCNQTSYCVLYVGQNQNDFTVPKVFSAPFLIAPGSGTAATTSPGTTSTAAPGSGTGSSTSANGSASQASTSSSAATSSGATAPATATAPADPSGALANTGSPAEEEWVALAGLTLLLTGALGRRFTFRDAA